MQQRNTSAGRSSGVCSKLSGAGVCHFVGKATCISIMRDERNGRLLIKYSATDCNLEVRVGCLAQIRDAGGTACGVAEAVHAAVARFCTRRALHPGLTAGRPRRAINLEAQVHIQSTIEMFTADGTSNEQLAGKMIHPGRSMAILH